MEVFLNMEFTVFVALAFLLYAIRRATKINKHYLPVLGVVFGVAFSAFEAKGFNFDIMMQGIEYAFYATFILMGGKYAQQEYNVRRKNGKQSNNKGNQTTVQSNENSQKINVNQKY